MAYFLPVGIADDSPPKRRCGVSGLRSAAVAGGKLTHVASSMVPPGSFGPIGGGGGFHRSSSPPYLHLSAPASTAASASLATPSVATTTTVSSSSTAGSNASHASLRSNGSFRLSDLGGEIHQPQPSGFGGAVGSSSSSIGAFGFGSTAPNVHMRVTRGVLGGVREADMSSGWLCAIVWCSWVFPERSSEKRERECYAHGQQRRHLRENGRRDRGFRQYDRGLRRRKRRRQRVRLWGRVCRNKSVQPRARRPGHAVAVHERCSDEQSVRLGTAQLATGVVLVNADIVGCDNRGSPSELSTSLPGASRLRRTTNELAKTRTRH